MTTILKLGGSVITEKDVPETVDDEALDQAVAAIAEADTDDLVIVHGGGSFGHHHASRHGISTTAGSDDAVAALEIHGAMKRLNDAVLNRLHEAGVPALPVHPFSTAHRDRAGTLFLEMQSVRTMLSEGFVPVLHGDLVAHQGEGVTVVSGDELVVSLAEGLDADRLGLCSSVPGVLDDDGDVIPKITSFDAVSDVLGGSDSPDVTGGMAGKVASLLELSLPAAIFSVDDLPAFLADEQPGTRVTV